MSLRSQETIVGNANKRVINVFVYTKNERTKQKLEALGFDFIRKDGAVYVFYNQNDLKFSLEEMEDCCLIYSNEITF